MRILHVLAQLPAQTGSGIYYQNLIRGLSAYGHEQRAVFARQGQAAFDFLPPEQQVPVDFCTAELPFPIAGMSDIMPYPHTVYGQMDQQMLECWQGAFGRVLRQAAAEFRPQAVILHHLWMLTSLAVGLFPDAVKIGVCHNTDLRQGVLHPNLVERYVDRLPGLDGVFALSELQMAPMEDLYGIAREKVLVLGGGFDQRLFYPPKERRTGTDVQLVYAAKIDPSKGVYALLEAFRLVCAQKSHLSLCLVGTPDGENARRLAPYLDSGLPITTRPALPQGELAELFRGADLFVLPSFFEGLGLTALEAMACGLRVVATENPGLTGLLSESVNASGVIEYVPLPTMETVDRPREDALPDFSRRLADKLLCQVERLERGEGVPPETLRALGNYSWEGIAEQANAALLRLARG